MSIFTKKVYCSDCQFFVGAKIVSNLECQKGFRQKERAHNCEVFSPPSNDVNIFVPKHIKQWWED